MADDMGMKDRILEAAMAEFAERGYTGASLRSIAARVGVTAALVNYHFGSKEKLAAAVVEAERLAIGSVDFGSEERVTSDTMWRAVLKDFIFKVVDVLTADCLPNRYFAPLYRFEAANIEAKNGLSLHDVCLKPIYRRLRRLVALGVADHDPLQADLWSVSLWNLILAYALKDMRRVSGYIPADVSPGAFKSMAVDFMVDRILGTLRFTPATDVA